MSVAMRKFFRTKEFILNETIHLISDTVKIAILKPGFVYSKNMVRFSDISGLEIEQTLYYPSGGVEIDSKSITTDASTGKAEYVIGTVKFPQIDNTMRYIIVYSEATANGIVNPLICYGEFSLPLTFASSAFVLNWPEPLIRW